MPQSKSPLKSKTIGANLALLAAYALQMKYGFVVPAEYQAAAATVINVALRTATSTALALRK